MDRRQVLRAMAVGVGVAFAGCGETQPDDTETESTPSPTPSDVELPVARNELRWPLAQDAIPAIVDPVFGNDWSGLDPDEPDVDSTLPDDSPVIGVERDGEARAYPLRILDWHEIVNDEHGGPIAITYCSLCGSGLVFGRQVAGEPTTFGVSGALRRKNLVMYDDATESLWSQLLATAIRGPRTGEQLTVFPSTSTTWGEWRTNHPDTVVLLPPPESDTVRDPNPTYDYFSPKYGYEGESQLVGWDSIDGDLHSRTLVVGVEAEGMARAYPFHVVSDEEVVNDRVGTIPVVVTTAPDGSLVAYDRRVDGRTFTFEPAGEDGLVAGGSRWERATGRAIDGPHEGTTLERANEDPPMFWLGWSTFNPDTEVYGIELDDEDSTPRNGD